jgi:hypothetical protein
MENALSVGRREPPGQIDSNRKRLGEGNGFVKTFETLPAHVLGNEERAAMDLAHAVNGDDIRVREPREGSSFLEEALAYLSLEPRVLRQPDLPHCSLAELAQEAKFLE